MSAHVHRSPLRLRGFGVTLGRAVVLAAIDLELPPVGMTVLLGPSGSGKSTLLRTLAGHNATHPSLGVWGDVEATAPPALVAQHARFYIDTPREHLAAALPGRARLTKPAQLAMIRQRLLEEDLGAVLDLLDEDVHRLAPLDQRRLALARALIPSPHVIMLDEPTAGLSEAEAAVLLDGLSAQAARRSVLVVTHHQGHAQRLGGTTVLIGGGRVIATAPTATFFACPPGDLAASFVRTGGLPLPAPVATPDERVPAEDAPATLRPAIAPPAAAAVVAQRCRDGGPRGFFWVLPGLAGLPRPGITDELSRDLEALARVGITTLVTLEERATVPPPAAAAVGIDVVHAPIVDMGAPTVAAATALCREIATRRARGGHVAVHCRAGLGRTGTVLAAYLIAEGRSAVAALEQVRRIHPGWVQSDAQLAFLGDFARHQLAGDRAS